MAYDGFAIDKYVDADRVTAELDALIRQPIFSINREKLEEYEEEYF